MSDVAAERLHQLLCTLQQVTSQVDHDIGIQAGNALAKPSGFLFDRPVHFHALDRLPSWVREVGVLQTPADADDRVPGLD
jgi:hypothetical protein